LSAAALVASVESVESVESVASVALVASVAFFARERAGCTGLCSLCRDLHTHCEGVCSRYPSADETSQNWLDSALAHAVQLGAVSAHIAHRLGHRLGFWKRPEGRVNIMRHHLNLLGCFCLLSVTTALCGCGGDDASAPTDPVGDAPGAAGAPTQASSGTTTTPNATPVGVAGATSTGGATSTSQILSGDAGTTSVGGASQASSTASDTSGTASVGGASQASSTPPGTGGTSQASSAPPATGGTSQASSTPLGNGGVSATGGTSAASSSPPSSGIAVLKELGMDTRVGSRLDPAGNKLPADYNPVLRPITQLAKRSELFIAGTAAEGDNWFQNGKYRHAVLDWPDAANAFVSANLNEDDAWMDLPKAMASGDLDGDGIDEMFVATVKDSTSPGIKELALQVIKRKTSSGAYATVYKKTLGPIAALSEYPDNRWWQHNFSAACGDLDGNGASETLLAFNGSVYLVGDANKDYGLLRTIPYAKDGYTGQKLLRVAAGDLTNDGADEFVVTEGSIPASGTPGTAEYHIYQGLLMDEIAKGTITTTKAANTVTLRGANCAVGDLDADGLNEVLFIGPATDATYYMMVLERSWNATTKRFEFTFKPDYETIAGREATNYSPLCAIADFDGDGKKDVLAYRYIYHNLSKFNGTFKRMSQTRAGVTSDLDLYGTCGTPTLGAHYDNSMAVGDVDGDLKADLAFISDFCGELCTMGMSSAGVWVRKGTGNIANTCNQYPAVTMGDYDGDSVTVEFKGSELLFSNPHPIAVIASNPYWSGIDMDGSTSFGTTKATEQENTHNIGFSVGISFGYEAEGLFDVYKASIKTSFESSFDWSATEATSVEESYSYTTSNEDQVVFTAIPYDVYHYEVIQAPANSKLVGKQLTVNLPRKPLTMPVERTFYNAHNGSALDIDGTVLTHQIGDPLSYPSSRDADLLIASGNGQGLKSSETRTVGEGAAGSGTSIEMSQSKSVGSSFNFELEVTLEAEAGAFGATVGASAGFHYGESYSITTTKGTLFSAEVSNIPEADFSFDKSFDWGLFTYRGRLGAEEFIVVQYYTEPHN
jgi:hypothetical protein